MLKKILVMGVAIIMCMGLFSACGDAELKQGIYVTDDELASVTLLADNEFIFVKHIATSYAPTGIYSNKKGKLVLHVSESEEYIFDIKNSQLVFVSGNGIEDSLAKGTIFKLSEK